ncbi:MAG: DTW domain-containing protein [Methylotenera sp.]|nr:DTW domain-containing protein [Oligoflexia bacterium]
MCSEIKPIATQHPVLILQHPQEPDQDLGSARLAHLSLPNSILKVGLSWPNLKAALGRETDPTRWAVFYLGSGIKDAVVKEGDPAPRAVKKTIGLQICNKNGIPLPNQLDAKRSLEGIIILDGTWSQAKTLWWRNAWLLKLKRAILTPAHGSLYKELRKEPRRECLSSIETIAQSLRSMGEPAHVEEELTALFGKLLDKQRGRLKEKKQNQKQKRDQQPTG